MPGTRSPAWGFDELAHHGHIPLSSTNGRKRARRSRASGERERDPRRNMAPGIERVPGACGLARPTGLEPLGFGFVEDIHVSSNTCKDVQACANTGSVSDEKSKNVQTHASLSKDLAGSLMDGLPPESEISPRMQPLLSVRQVAKLLGVCAATVYRLCEQGRLPHFRVLNAIRIDPRDLKKFLAGARPRGPRTVAGSAANASHRGEGGEPNRSAWISARTRGRGRT